MSGYAEFVHIIIMVSPMVAVIALYFNVAMFVGWDKRANGGKWEVSKFVGRLLFALWLLCLFWSVSIGMDAGEAYKYYHLRVL